MTDHYRRDADAPSFARCFDEIDDRLERIANLRDQWASGDQTGREISVRLDEIAELARLAAVAQDTEDKQCRAISAATVADFMEEPR